MTPSPKSIQEATIILGKEILLSDLSSIIINEVTERIASALEKARQEEFEKRATDVAKGFKKGIIEQERVIKELEAKLVEAKSALEKARAEQIEKDAQIAGKIIEDNLLDHFCFTESICGRIECQTLHEVTKTIRNQARKGE